MLVHQDIQPLFQVVTQEQLLTLTALLALLQLVTPMQLFALQALTHTHKKAMPQCQVLVPVDVERQVAHAQQVLTQLITKATHVTPDIVTPVEHAHLAQVLVHPDILTQLLQVATATQAQPHTPTAHLVALKLVTQEDLGVTQAHTNIQLHQLTENYPVLLAQVMPEQTKVHVQALL